MDHTAAVLPSPFLPPVAYRPLLGALETAGYATRLADAAAPTSGDELVRRWGPAVAGADLVVAHSNAGYLAPLVRAGAAAPLVLVDAALPPEVGPTTLAPARFREHLGTLADDDGRLPPWTRWWPRASLVEVVPPELVDELDAACPRVPLAYLDSRVSAPPGWAGGRNAYLAFGETYADEVAFARAQGWPTTVLPGTHLHFLWDPAGVATAVDALAQALR